MSHAQLLRLLQGATAVGLVVAVVALVLPPSTAVTPLAAALPPVGPADSVAVAPDSAVVDGIVDGNIFSSTRRRPLRRTLPAGATTLADTMASLGLSLDDPGSAAGVPADSAAPRVEDAVPRLYGVVDGPAGPQALLRLERARPGASLYRAGEGAGGWRVRRIDSDRVLLDGPRGGLVLRLMPRRSTP